MEPKIYDPMIPPIESEPRLAWIKFVGFLIFLLLFGGIGVWSVMATLDAAAIAPGKLVVESKHKKIQHLEGGIVKKIYVKDGAVVKKGDILIELDETQSDITLKLAREQVYSLLALESRLLAEVGNKPTVEFHQRLLDKANDPEISAIIEGQNKIFYANKKELDSIRGILKQRIAQLEKSIESIRAQIQSEGEQLKYIDEELEAVSYLEKKKLIEKPRLLELKRAKARLVGNRDEHKGMVAREYQRIGEAKLQMINTENTRRKEQLKELRETQQKLAEILNKEKAAADVRKRIQIKAPNDGIVLGLQKHTLGGVIAPGQEVLTIVPNAKKLIIEAQLSPLDIDVVHKGLVAKVRLSSYKQRSAPTMEGIVDDVSADVYLDEANNTQYYQVKINLSTEELAQLKNVKMYPGMPVEVMIITDNRTPFSYIAGPIIDSFSKAFKEE